MRPSVEIGGGRDAPPGQPLGDHVESRPAQEAPPIPNIEGLQLGTERLPNLHACPADVWCRKVYGVCPRSHLAEYPIDSGDLLGWSAGAARQLADVA